MWGCGAGEARFAGSEEVVGSNPTSSTNFMFGILLTKVQIMLKCLADGIRVIQPKILLVASPKNVLERGFVLLTKEPLIDILVVQVNYRREKYVRFSFDSAS